MSNTDWASAWREFRKSHFEVPTYEKPKGDYKRITCACGWKNDLRGNAGIALGYKIAWQNHFYSIYPEFISKGQTDNPDENIEVANCEKCDLPSDCTVEKSWHSAKGRVESYCLEHSKEFENLPGFKVTYIKGGDYPEVTSTLANPFPNVTESSRAHLPLEVRESKASGVGGKYLKWVTYFLLFFAAGGLLTWNDNVQTRNDAIEILQARNEFVNTCFYLKDENLAAMSGPVGSIARNNAVTSFYEQVIEAPCVVWGDGTVLKNQFYGVNSSSANWSSLSKAYLYSLQRWNSVEEISLWCADGWQSPSIGKQGACSSHGGVVSGFNESKNSDLAGFLSGGEEIYPALYILEEAAK
jgi:hypothetical protein